LLDPLTASFIVLYALFKSFSLFRFNDILMKVFNLFHISVKLLSRKVHTWSLTPTPFWYQDITSVERYTGPCNQLVPLVIKGCRSINKQFGIDSFHDWERHHWVFACSSNHSTLLATFTPRWGPPVSCIFQLNRKI